MADGDKLTKENSVNLTGYIWDTRGMKPESELSAGEKNPSPWKLVSVTVLIEDIEKLGFKKVDKDGS